MDRPRQRDRLRRPFRTRRKGAPAMDNRRSALGHGLCRRARRTAHLGSPPLHQVARAASIRRTCGLDGRRGRTCSLGQHRGQTCSAGDRVEMGRPFFRMCLDRHRRSDPVVATAPEALEALYSDSQSSNACKAHRHAGTYGRSDAPAQSRRAAHTYLWGRNRCVRRTCDLYDRRSTAASPRRRASQHHRACDRWRGFANRLGGCFFRGRSDDNVSREIVPRSCIAI